MVPVYLLGGNFKNFHISLGVSGRWLYVTQYPLAAAALVCPSWKVMEGSLLVFLGGFQKYISPGRILALGGKQSISEILVIPKFVKHCEVDSQYSILREFVPI